MRKDGEEKTGGAVVAESEDASLFVALGVTAKGMYNSLDSCCLFDLPCQIQTANRQLVQ
jgi:hypothetical protein